MKHRFVTEVARLRFGTRRLPELLRVRPRQSTRLCAIVIGALFISGCLQAEDAHSVRLFNGQNFDGWYVFTTETGYENPGVFQVVDGMIYVPGGKGDTAYFGGLISKKSYENYQLEFEYKWGEATYGQRQGKTRDAGVLLHCVGPNGPGPWMTSYEFQIIEGGTGDLLVVNAGRDDDGNPIALRCTAEAVERDGQRYFQPGGQSMTIETGRLNWYGRDPKWQDEVGFRGRRDVESPHGQWTKCKIIVRGDTLEYFVNGQLVNRATALSNRRGKIFLQTEGAEVWYRNVILSLHHLGINSTVKRQGQS